MLGAAVASQKFGLKTLRVFKTRRVWKDVLFIEKIRAADKTAKRVGGFAAAHPLFL